MPTSTTVRLRRSSRLVFGAFVASVIAGSGCDADDTRPAALPEGLDRDAIEDAIGDALTQAAAHVKDESNWVLPDDDGGADDGGQTGGDGASCAGSCGEPAQDGSCYCDAECGSNGDCCSDYEAQCGGGGGDDGAGDGGGDDGANDDGADDGGAAGSCAGSCGDVGSDGACYCDAQCTSNGDCCSDYASLCGGGDDGGGDDGSGDAGSCYGYCGGEGSDGACYCDDQCTANGDCCSDYQDACAYGDVAEISFDLVAPRPTMKNGDACWGVITDPVDVGRIAEAAAIGGSVVGGSCVAVLVVPAGVGAAPTAGVSVGAAALACSGGALGGVAAGAVGELVAQRMGNIVECSGGVMAAIMQIFPWGQGEKVEVPVYGSTSPAPSGDCTPDEKDALQADVTEQCKTPGQRSCSYADTCETLVGKIETSAACIGARQKINSQCFGGGDAGHNQQVQQEVNLQNNCYDISTSSGC